MSLSARARRKPAIEGGESMSLPLEIVYNAEGQLYCVVCRRILPGSKKNIEGHLSGSKHEKFVKRTNPEENAKHRNEILAAAAHSATATSSTAGITANSAPHNSAVPNRISSTGSTDVSRTAAAVNAIVHLNPNSTHHLHKIQIDKDEFLNSILAGSDNSEVETKSDGDATAFTAAERARAFAPMEYRPPGGIDNFFDSMPEEEQRTKQPAELRAILETATPKKKAVPATEQGPNDNMTPVSMSLVVNNSDAEMEEAEVKDGEVGEGSASEEEPQDDMPPWLLGPDVIQAVKYTNDTSLALHYEILEFARFMSPTASESGNREKVVSTVQNIVKALWPECHIEIFGSYATGLYLPSSDIDICVMGTPLGGDMSEIEDVARAVRNLQGFARRVNVIKARVSLVKLVAREGGVQCDISFNQPHGPQNVPVIRHYLKHYPALRPLLLVVKCFLQQRSLNEVFTGGLGSYAILLLVVSHLQMVRYNFPGMNANLGAVLHQFFVLYGRLFNHCVAGIAVKNDGCYYNKVVRYDTIPSETIRFSIEDPNDETNEIGKNSYSAARVRKAFSNAAVQLKNWSRDDVTGPPTPLSTILQPDVSFRRRRKQVRTDLQNRGILSLSSSIKAGIFSCGESSRAEIPIIDLDSTANDTSAANANANPAYSDTAPLHGGHPSKRMRTHHLPANGGEYTGPQCNGSAAQMPPYVAPYAPQYGQEQQNHLNAPQMYNGSSYATQQSAYPMSHQGGYHAGGSGYQTYNGPPLSAEMQMRLGDGQSHRRDRDRRDIRGRSSGIQRPKRRGRPRNRTGRN